MNVGVPAMSARYGTRWRLHGERVALLVLVVALIAWPRLVGSSYLLYVSTLVVLYAIGAMGLHLLFRMGLVSFGHAAFLGVGGYTGALLMTGTGLAWPLAFIAAALASGALGLLVGPVVLRLRGVYFVLFTVIFGEFTRQVFDDWTGLTNGAGGIAGIPSPVPFTSPAGFFYLSLVVALLCAGVCARLLRCDLGQAIDAIRASETLASSNGVPVFHLKVIVFAIACFFAGLQGALQACFVQYISPASYGFDESLRFVVMNVVGGMNTLWGPVLGSVFIVALPELLRNWVDYQWVMYGVVLILVMRYLPGGLADLLALAGGGLRRQRS